MSYVNVESEKIPLPIGLNRISWKQQPAHSWALSLSLPLPIGLNRISWKLLHL